MEIEGAKEGDLLHPPRVVLALRTENELWRRCEQPVTHHQPPPQVGDAVLVFLWLAIPNPDLSSNPNQVGDEVLAEAWLAHPHPNPNPNPNPNPHQVGDEVLVEVAADAGGGGMKRWVKGGVVAPAAATSYAAGAAAAAAAAGAAAGAASIMPLRPDEFLVLVEGD